jgi:hypothetical protein
MSGDPAADAVRMDRMAAELYGAAGRVEGADASRPGGAADLVSDQSVTEFLAAVPHASHVHVR